MRQPAERPPGHPLQIRLAPLCKQVASSACSFAYVRSSTARRSATVRAVSAEVEKAVLAGGCFWGMQDLIRKRAGVLSTRVGYSGGDVANATYRNHGTHAEAIEIVFDPKQ